MWKPVDTEFYCPRTPVEVVCNGGLPDYSLLARDLVECLRGTAHVHGVGTPTDFLKVISQGERAAPYMVISMHGDEKGLVFGEFADPIDTSMLVDECMPPECIAQHVNLPGCVVLNLACGGGEAEMAQAFMKGGLAAYIGNVDPIPDGTAGPMLLAHFFYKLARTGCSPREAWEQAASYDRDSRLFVCWDAEGCHRVE